MAPTAIKNSDVPTVIRADYPLTPSRSLLQTRRGGFASRLEGLSRRLGGLANISNSALGRSLRILAGLLPCVALTRCRRLFGCLRALSLGLRSHVVLLSLPGSSRSYLPGSSRSYPR